MCAADFQYQQHLAVFRPSIEFHQPLQEDFLCHSVLLAAAILTAKVLEIDMAAAARSGVLACDPQGHFVEPVTVTADSDIDPLLVYLSSL